MIMYKRGRQWFGGIIGNSFETSCSWGQCWVKSGLASKSMLAPPTPLGTEGVAKQKVGEEVIRNNL